MNKIFNFSVWLESLHIKEINRYLIAIVLLNLSACAMGPVMVNHTFSFDTIGNSPDGKHPEVEVIDYQYGASRQFATLANREMVTLGMPFKGGHISGLIQRGEFLYVKWRVLATGDVFEDRVDLRERLPAEMETLKLHFVIRGAQLYVFLIYPWDGKPWKRELPRTEFLPIPGGVKRYEGSKYVQIYPDPPPAQ